MPKVKSDEGKWPIVLILWRDAFGGSNIGWRPINDIARSETVVASTVGFLLKEDKDRLVVCPHMTGADDCDGDGEIAIPASWVIKKTVLRK